MFNIINFELIKNVLFMSILTSLIITNLVQKIKENFDIKNSKRCIYISFIISIILGTLFSVSFSTLSPLYSLWSSLFSFLGADFIYNILEGKVFNSYS